MWRTLATLASLTLVACTGPKADGEPAAVSDAQGGCESRIIVSFNEPLSAEPDNHLVADLGRVAQARVTYVTSVAPDIFVFSIAARQANPECENAMERLRHHPRVRAVESDVRMRHHG